MKRRFSLKVWIMDSFEQVLQVFMLIGVISLPFIFDFQSVVEIKKPDMEIQELVIYYALRHGKICISIILAVIMIKNFHSINSKKVLNKGNLYHRRTMFGYWICSHILGYSKCSLIRVPISDQFKLILSDMFTDYICGNYEKASEDEKISVRKVGEPLHSDLLQQNATSDVSIFRFDVEEVYIVISDTYPITDNMLPDRCDENNTIIIQREKNREDYTRYESKALINKVLNIIKHIDNEVIINILPTTNVINTYGIANEVFKTGRQDNIKSLYVFPQLHESSCDWAFADKGIKIF